MEIFSLDNYNVGFVTDCHCATSKLDEIRAKHPDIETWFFLGDLFEFQTPWANDKTAKWLRDNINKYIWIIGNHDAVVANKYLNITHDDKLLIVTNFFKSIALILPNGRNLFLCHSKPKDFWEFINKDYTEREFTDDFAGFVDENTWAVVNGHTHEEKKHIFVETDTEIWNVGASRDGKYGILTEKGIEFKRL